MQNSTPKYKRVLLKLSGEAIAKKVVVDGKEKIVDIYDFDFIFSIAEILKKCVAQGVQIGVIVGAGNIWRGRRGEDMDRARADSMGMLATTMNALALQDAFIRSGLDTKVMTAVPMDAYAEPYVIRNAVQHLENGKIVIFGGGLGAPYFSTDTAAALRAAEINAEVVLMAKNVDAIYSADPQKVKDAVKYDEITYKDILSNELKALDLTAAAFCMDNDIDSYAFGLRDPMNIYRVIMGEHIGTVLHK